GVAPSVAIVGDDVQEVHTTADGQRRQQVRGTLDRRGRKIEWQAARATQAAALPRDVADWESHTLRSARDDEGAVGCSFDGGVLTAARYPQVAFVELQKGEDPGTLRDALFFAADAKATEAIAEARTRGLVGRAWAFDDGDQTGPPTPPQENMPATDTPNEPFYAAYMAGVVS